MKVRFWGVRGSIPIPGSETLRYGGNTPCIEVEGSGGECIILDAGTGLRVMGIDLVKRSSRLPDIHLFISHTHWDHIQGFPFFAPCYVPGAVINLRGPAHFFKNKSLESVFDILMQYDFFPVSSQQLAARIAYESIMETSLEVGTVGIKTQFANHPVQSLVYRLTQNGRTLVYTGDHEPYYNLFGRAGGAGAPGQSDDDVLFGDVESTVADANGRFIDFIRGADLFVVDSQYTPEEYPETRRNWVSVITASTTYSS